MRVVIQRVSQAQVVVLKEVIGEIGHGLMLLLGVTQEDQQEDAEWLVKKITQLRIFNDENGIMNRSLEDIDGEMLVISQFTLYGQTKKGNRPSYTRAAGHEKAVPLYEYFCDQSSELLGKAVARGRFGADMQVSLTNDGPVTIVMDSKQRDL